MKQKIKIIILIVLVIFFIITVLDFRLEELRTIFLEKAYKGFLMFSNVENLYLPYNLIFMNDNGLYLK